MDGIYQTEESPPFVVELKHPGKIDHQMALDGVVPEKYIPQCLHILEDIPTAEKILYVSYRNDDDVAEIWLHRDKHELHIQFAEELSFYSKLISFRPPEPTERDWINFSGAEFKAKAAVYLFLKKEMEEMEKKLETLKTEIIQGVEGFPRAKIGDLKVQKVSRQGSIDYSKIEALNGLDLNPYRKPPITSWRLS